MHNGRLAHLVVDQASEVASVATELRIEELVALIPWQGVDKLHVEGLWVIPEQYTSENSVRRRTKGQSMPLEWSSMYFSACTMKREYTGLVTMSL